MSPMDPASWAAVAVDDELLLRIANGWWPPADDVNPVVFYLVALLAFGDEDVQP